LLILIKKKRKNMIERPNNRIDSLLPPPEVLERYRELGMGENLVDLIRAEQKHRHALQNRYAISYRVGQITGMVAVLYYFYGVFNLIGRGLEKQAYTLTYILSGLVLLSVLIIRRKKDEVAKRRANRQTDNTNTNNRHGSNNSNGGRTSSGYRRASNS
jgi:uncharacterized membrane protein